ncbi:MAG: hypothetical protein WC436_03725 [Candidatus Babeliales bacterium]
MYILNISKKIVFLFFCILFSNISANIGSNVNLEIGSNIGSDVASNVKPGENNPYPKIAKFLLTNFITQESTINSLLDLNKEEVKEKAKPKEFEVIPKIENDKLTEEEQLKIIFRIFSNSKEIKNLTEEKIVNDNLYYDLEFFCSKSTNNKQNNLLCKIDNTNTLIGKIYLAKMLFQPTANIEVLTQRQAIIKELIDNKTLFNSLDKKLKDIKIVESELIWFWKKMSSELEKILYTIIFSNPNSIKGQIFNKNSELLNFYHVMDTINYGMFQLIHKVGAPATALFYLNKIWKDPLISQNANSKLNMAFNGGYFAFFEFYILPQVLKIQRSIFDLKNQLHEKTNALAKYTLLTQSIYNTISSNETLKSNLEDIKVIKNLLKNNSKENSDLKKLLENLKTDTFKKEASILSNKGKALSSFQLMQQEKDKFISSLEVIGQIDAYLSIAKLYKKFENNVNAKYSFVEYLKPDEVNQAKPYIYLKDFWTPFLDVEKIVTNDFEIGNKNNNIVLTGPNAGGKSTVLKSIIINLLLAQTIGIAPSSKIIITPFCNIKTYLNITDEIGEKSLFQAEMDRALDFINSVESLKKNEFSFVIMDEIFTGTDPDEGLSGAYGIAETLATFPNNICLVATHFKKLTELGKDTQGAFKNYKVSVIKNSDGSFIYPYKLEEGISNQRIALDLLKLKGFNPKVLDNAYKIFNSIN